MNHTDKLRLNAYKHSVLFVGHMQTAENAASDQVIHYLLTEHDIKIWIETKNTTQQPFKLK